MSAITDPLDAGVDFAHDDPATVAVVGLDGSLRYVGTAAARVLGVAPEALKDRRFVDLAHPDSVIVANELLHRLTSPGQQTAALLQLRTGIDADGSARFQWVTSTAARLPSGLPLGPPQPATNAVRTEELLLMILRPYRPSGALHATGPALTARLLHHPQEIVALTGDDRRIVFVSDHCEILFGWTPEELAERYLGLIHPEDVQETFIRSVAVRSGSDVEQIGQNRLRHLDGSWRRADIHAFSLMHVPGVGGVVNSVRLSRDQPAPERGQPVDLAGAWARGQQSTYAVILHDAQGAVLLATPAVHALWGLDPLRLQGMSVDDLLAGATAGGHIPAEAGAWAPCRIQVCLADGSRRWAEGHIHNLLGDPSISGVLWTLTDVHERVEAELALKASEERFRALVQNALDLIEITDEHGVVTWISPSVRTLFDTEPDVVVGRPAHLFVHPDDRLACADLLRYVTAQPGRTGQTVCRAGPDGTAMRWLEATATNHLDTPAVNGVVWNLRDVTDRMAALRDTNRMNDILDATSDYVGISEPGRGLVYLNPAARRFLGIPLDLPASEVPESLVRERWLGNQWESEVRPALQARDLWSGEVTMHDGDGRPVPLSTVLISHRGPDGRVDVLSAITRDISERKAFEATLEHQATHDPLTALPNRTLLLDRLEVAIGRAERRKSALAVLFLDLDHFKVVNDSLGHGLGDRLLISLAGQLAELVRPGDTVARFGGDEFVILCEDLTGPDEARQIAERIASAVAEPVVIGDTEVVVTVSVGIAFAHGGSVPAEDLIRDADAAMYQAKSRGRARAEVFDSRMRARSIDRLELEAALRRAIDRRELRVFYQPYLDIRTGAIVGAEALVRWAHPERGLLLPHDFLAVAEETRLIVPIGNWVIRQACLMEQRTRATVPDHEPLTFCVNLSGRQLAHPHLVEDIAAVLHETSCDPAHLDLEITEHVLMDDVAITASTLRRLKELGVQLAVDDFGTGYSSLAYLKRFPVDVLKVDQTFVAGLGQNAEDTAIVTAVVNLAHTLGLKAIAEGVETAGQLAELRRLGCDMAQGFYVGRPMPDADLLELI